MSAADIKSAFEVFGKVSHVMLKPAGVWQYVIVYFKELDTAASALTHLLILVDKIVFFKAKLINLSSGCTAFKISDMIFQIGGQTCFIPCLSDSGYCSWFALVIFGSQVDLKSVVVKTSTLRKCHIWWKISGCWCCFKCQKIGHLVVDCKISPPSSLKTPKMFKPHFVNNVSYAKAFASLDFSEFFLLMAPISLFMVVGDLIMSFWLASVEFDLVKLSVLVEFIVKPVGFLVKLFE
ncbi:hypothetical protein G9A89_009958 [Geosiphon pyriformis]|nr:hypothetical protein G9A89_009958 [Geosiphon pyriformis]